MKPSSTSRGMTPSEDRDLAIRNAKAKPAKQGRRRSPKSPQTVQPLATIPAGTGQPVADLPAGHLSDDPCLSAQLAMGIAA